MAGLGIVGGNGGFWASFLKYSMGLFLCVKGVFDIRGMKNRKGWTVRDVGDPIRILSLL